MPYRIITVPFDTVNKTFNCDDINNFCINKKIISKKIKYFISDEIHYWSVFLEYENILEPVKDDLKELSEAGRLCFERLRNWRKERAEKEGIPPYLIAKNSHFIDIIKKEIKTAEGLKQLESFGDKKIEKYSRDLIDIIKTFYINENER